MSEDRVSGPHVLLLADYDSFGGTRTYFKHLLALYYDKGASVTIVRTYQNDDEEIDDLSQGYGFRCIDLQSITRDGSTKKRRFLVRLLLERIQFRKFVKKLNIDIIVASVGTPGLFLGVMGLSKRSIYILHTYPEITGRSVIRGIRKFLFSFFLRAKQVIITVSNFSKKRILTAWGLGENSNNVIVIYSTIGEVARANASWQGGAIRVVTVGHVVEYKNPMTWINLAIMTKMNSVGLDVKFTWVGDGKMLEDCRERVKKLGAESYITFAGRDDDIEKYYDQCDIYVQPSLMESLGLSVLDAMRHGKPCVVANTGGLPEVVADGQTGWVVPVENVEVMAQKIGELAKDAKLREMMGRSAMQAYKAKFSKQRWSDEMWHLHESILTT